VTATVALGVRGLADVAAGDAESVGGKAANLGELVRAGFPVPPVREAYAALPDDAGGGALVAVRSSAVGEDGADSSFAGVNSTFTNVRGVDELLRRIVDCWASVFGAGFLTGPRHRRAHPPQRTGLRPDLPGRRSAARAAAEPPCESPEAP
jgi:pyruvate, water dikinase